VYDASSHYDFAEHTRLLVDFHMDVELAILIDAVHGEQWLCATEAPQVVCALLTSH